MSGSRYCLQHLNKHFSIQRVLQSTLGVEMTPYLLGCLLWCCSNSPSNHHASCGVLFDTKFITVHTLSTNSSRNTNGSNIFFCCATYRSCRMYREQNSLHCVQKLLIGRVFTNYTVQGQTALYLNQFTQHNIYMSIISMYLCPSISFT